MDREPVVASPGAFSYLHMGTSLFPQGFNVCYSVHGTFQGAGRKVRVAAIVLPRTFLRSVSLQSGPMYFAGMRLPCIAGVLEGGHQGMPEIRTQALSALIFCHEEMVFLACTDMAGGGK